MIYDHIKNIGLYKGLSDALDTALDFIAGLTADAENGVTMLEGGVKAIVSRYETKLVNEYGYEAHRKYADVQYLLAGRETVRVKPLDEVTESTPYNPEGDCALYKDEAGLDFTIGDGYFLVVFPDDAHEPCLALEGKPESVVKVVMKVPLG